MHNLPHSMKRKIGIYPGTFNPLHAGHISLAEQAFITCGLDEVLFLPERAPWGKTDVPHIDSRVQFAEKILSDYPNFRIRALRATPHTFKAHRVELKDIYNHHTIVLLIGSDTLKTLVRWEDIGLFLRDHELCVGLRGNETRESVLAQLMQLESVLAQNITYHIVETPHRHVSSTKIRSTKTYLPL